MMKECKSQLVGTPRLEMDKTATDWHPERKQYLFKKVVTYYKIEHSQKKKFEIKKFKGEYF